MNNELQNYTVIYFKIRLRYGMIDVRKSTQGTLNNKWGHARQTDKMMLPVGAL
jgi:hypothetical protein